MNYVKQNHLSLLIILFLIGSSFMGGSMRFGALDTTTIGNPWTFSGAVTHSGAMTNTGTVTLTGTTTIASSPDGFVAGGTISTVATNTARTVYTNAGASKLCDGSTGFLYVRSSAFSPSLIWSLGTTTGSSGSANMIASSTVATTTSTLVNTNGSSFVLAHGDSITAIFSDITNTEASSTYFSNWTAEAGVWCQNLSI